MRERNFISAPRLNKINQEHYITSKQEKKLEVIHRMIGNCFKSSFLRLINKIVNNIVFNMPFC